MSRPIKQPSQSQIIDWVAQSPGALSDASAGIAHVVRGLLRSEKNGLSRIPCERGRRSRLPPSGAAVSYLSAVWCMCGVFAVPVRVMWLSVFAKICCGCLPSGDCNFSCTQLGDNSGCLDARSLTLPRYGLGVGRSAKVETYVIDLRLRSGLGYPKDVQFNNRAHLAKYLHFNQGEG